MVAAFHARLENQIYARRPNSVQIPVKAGSLSDHRGQRVWSLTSRSYGKGIIAHLLSNWYRTPTFYV